MHTSRRDRFISRAGLVGLVSFVSGCADSLGPSVELALSEPTVAMRAVRGTTTSILKTVAIHNGGDGRLGPVSCPPNPAAWLTCEISNGNIVRLTANPTGLAASPPEVDVLITAAGLPDRPASIPVSLIIDQPVLTLSASTANFTASEAGAGTTPTSVNINVTNTGAGTLANLGTVTCVPTPANARVTCAVSQGNGVLTLSVNAGGLSAGTYVFPVEVKSPNDNVAKTIAVTVAVAAIPRIALSQQAIVFQVIRGSAAPAPQIVTVTNSGGGSLGTVSCPANPATWLTCGVSGGGTTLTFTANPNGLTVSPAGVSVPVSATGATNSPQSVAVNFTIRQPVLSVTTTTVKFTAVQGTATTTPTSVNVTVTNSGEGTLASLGTIACVPPAQAPVTCVVDQTTGTLTFTVNPTGIVGTKLYPVEVSAPNSGVARTVTVSLTAAPGVSLSPRELNFEAIRGTTADIIKKVKVSNLGADTLGTISCPANPAAWLTCALATGDTLVFTAKPAGLTTSPAEVLVPVSAVGAFNNPQNVTVNLTILQPILSLNASVVNLTSAAGGTTAPAGVTVTNSGAGTLASLGTLQCVPSDAHVSCVPNQSTGQLTITVNTSTAPALTPGKYVYVVTVSAPNMGNTPQTIAIILTVT